MSKYINRTIDRELLSGHEAAEFLRVSSTEFNRIVDEGKIPCVPIRDDQKNPYFWIEDLRAFIKDRRRVKASPVHHLVDDVPSELFTYKRGR